MKTAANHYPELSDFENELIDRFDGQLARRFHLSNEDREDVRQELAICIFEKRSRHDPDKTPGCYEAYITTCLERESIRIVRKIRPEIFVGEPDGAMDLAAGEMAREVLSVESQALFRVLSEAAIGGLSAEQRELLRALAAGKNLAEIARESGIAYHIVRRRVAKLRQILKKRGLSPAAL